MSGKDTELTRTGVRGPYVDITVSESGYVRAKLHAWREKPRGGDEEITIEFKELGRSQLRCIARSAISALRELRETQDKLIVEDIESATGWKEDGGPS